MDGPFLRNINLLQYKCPLPPPPPQRPSPSPIKYHIEFEYGYFNRIFYDENITDKELQKARKEAEIKKIMDYLNDVKNIDKPIISYFKMIGDKKVSEVKINMINNNCAVNNSCNGCPFASDSEKCYNTKK